MRKDLIADNDNLLMMKPVEFMMKMNSISIDGSKKKILEQNVESCWVVA